MNQFIIYKDLQNLLLSMDNDDEILKCKIFISSNNLLKKQRKILSTMKLIASVVYSRPKLFNNAVKLLSYLTNVEIDKKNHQYNNLADKSIISRYIIISFLLKFSGNENYNNIIYYLDFEQFIDFNNPQSLSHIDNPFINAIFNDDIDQLQTLISNHKVEINKKIIKNRLQIHKLLKNANLLQYSAFYGSIKCFKYLLINSKNINYTDLFKCSIAGGNSEIIHIIEDKSEELNIDLECLHIAIQYMRNDLIDYLINNYDIKINGESYIQCIYSSNYEAMIKIIEIDERQNINEYGNNGSTPLDIAAFEGYVDFMKFLLLFEEVEIDKLNIFGKTILQSATKRNNLDTVKFIINNNLEDPNYRGHSSRTPFEMAYIFRFGEIFDLFDQKFHFYRYSCYCFNEDPNDENDDITDNSYVEKFIESRNISKKNKLKNKIERNKAHKKLILENKASFIYEFEQY